MSGTVLENAALAAHTAAEFQDAADAWVAHTGPEPIWHMWAFRLATELDALTESIRGVLQ